MRYPPLLGERPNHCHFSYRVGRYRSFLLWPTRQGAVEAATTPDGTLPDDFELITKHAEGCACLDRQETTC